MSATGRRHAGWRARCVAGGRFADIAPLFSRDERRVLVALESSVKVFDAGTGACVQTVGLGGAGQPRITCMAADPSNEFRLFVSYEDGSIRLWDWTDGAMLRCRQTRRGVRAIAASPAGVYAALEQPGPPAGACEVFCFAFPAAGRIARSQRIVRLGACVGMGLSGDGRVLAVGSTRSIFVCRRAGPEGGRPWETRRLSTASAISTLAVCGDHVAAGDDEGKLLVYYDALTRREPVARTFHWHAQPFSALSWALGESYVLTGGKESVLVFWQLKTGNRQFLPRLGSPIRKIGVSPTSSSYAVLLEDNSVKVIDAIDLRAGVEISGVQIGGDVSRRVPSAVHPATRDIILASQSLFSPTFLQSYDILSDRQVYKTEVVRMLHLETLEKNGLAVSRPRIAHVSLSMDGLWMATVDEWGSPGEDCDLCEENAEIYLKFWQWDSADKRWDLSTRIDSPHGLGKEVNGLHASPNKSKFSTIGADGSLKIWKLKVKNENAAVKTEIWVCHKVVRYTRVSHDSSRQNELSCMTWTLDGSMIVLGCRNILLIVNEQLGTICHTVDNLYRGKILSLEALGAFIIIVTKKNILVWDILRATTKWCLDIPKIYQSSKDFCLAADHANQLFAVSFNDPKEHNSKLYIFKITSPVPIFLKQHPHKIITLKHMPLNSSSSSFTFLDLSGRFFSLATDDTAFMKMNDSEPVQENQHSLSNIYGAALNRTIEPLPEDDMRSKTVSMEALSFIFDKPAYAMPSLTALLEETMKWIGEPSLKPFSKTFYSEVQEKE